MSIQKLQGRAEAKHGLYYEFDTEAEPLGVGGMGKVYEGRCVDERSGMTRKVAIKFMYDDLPDSAIERARREASIQIRNDNLVEMLGFIETETKDVLGESVKHYHVVSELLEGVSLDDMLQGKFLDRKGQVVQYAQKLYDDYRKDVYRFAIQVIRSVLTGLMSLHDAGYIHRDIDPTNIMVTSDGHIKLIDFGIAKQLRSLTTNDKSLTVAGVFMGKPEYAAPELVLGDIKSQGVTTDIYAMGILLFQCIVGHTPFEGDRHEVLHKQIHAKLPLHLIRNKELRKIVEKATQKNRADRYQSAAEFRVALERLPVSLKDDAIQWNKTKSIIAASVAGVALIGAGVAFWPESDDHSSPLPPEPQKSLASNQLTSSDTMTFNVALDLLKSDGAPKGVKYLNELSQKGYAEATLLLSRLYFEGKTQRDAIVESVVAMRKRAGVEIDNVKAHEMLELCVSQDANNYKALFELGKDYFGGRGRSEGYERDMDKAIDYFEKALAASELRNDDSYIDQCRVALKSAREAKQQIEAAQALGQANTPL